MKHHRGTEGTEGGEERGGEERGEELRLELEGRVRFEPVGCEIVVPVGTLLLDAARRAGLPVAQSCGGFAICSWCRMQVLEGEENLSPAEPNEERLARRQSFKAGERASCQAEVLGNVTVTTTYW